MQDFNLILCVASILGLGELKKKQKNIDYKKSD